MQIQAGPLKRYTIVYMDELGIVGPDNLGKHRNHRKTDEVILEGIRSHIKSFPVVESHYLRTQTRFLNCTGTHALVFNNEIKLGFLTPKKNQCEFFMQYTKASHRCIGKNHNKNKQISREMKRADVEMALKNRQIRVCDFDLQSNCYCYLWNEASGNKEAREITSCVYEYIKSINCKDFIFYGVNCCAQNKNKCLATMYLFATQIFQKVESITHKYFVVVHTQNAGDSMHSCFEKQKERVLKTGPVYIPSQRAGIL
ncbi:hypothetical protein PR048_012150 [Dryococelus australis]|uniref:Uncharacterized protein n=1 Tax=Dryococelus australis TaxID=614101 RepID=A0ABQ9HNJ8_9NEOP|nr:hypothetical protein PR048_012150 [Dryococelus australis]